LEGWSSTIELHPQQCGGGGRIRTYEAEATDLQSAPFDRSGTPPSARQHFFTPRLLCQGFLKQRTGKFGAGDRSRTHDLLITSQLLYQLSYTGNKVIVHILFLKSNTLCKKIFN
jgi:hypothetical protein